VINGVLIRSPTYLLGNLEAPSPIKPATRATLPLLKSPASAQTQIHVKKCLKKSALRVSTIEFIITATKISCLMPTRVRLFLTFFLSRIIPSVGNQNNNYLLTISQFVSSLLLPSSLQSFPLKVSVK
jgi:hypothetical protein